MFDLKQQARASFNANRIPEAFELYARVLSVNKKDPEALQVLGTISQRMGKLAEAEGYFRRALTFNKKNHELYYQLGSVLLAQGKGRDALDALQQSVKIRRNFFEPWLLLGNIYAFSGMLGKAMAAYRNANGINPAHPVPHCNLGNILAEMGDSGRAFEEWRRALELKPDYREAHDNILLCMNYGTGFSREEIHAAHLDWAQRHMARVNRRTTHVNSPDPGRKIRLAYISPDFREHSVAYFMRPVIAGHDRLQFELYLYSSLNKPDATTAWFRGAVDHFVDISKMQDTAVADLIERDAIDILVDLAGHTSGNRLAVLGYRPAPVQVSYLGYPNTTGLDTVDYRLTDAYADPADSNECCYTERLIRLEPGFLCYQPPEAAPDIEPPPCLEKGYITFGSFNYPAKISDEALLSWARILEQVPDSRLLLKYRSYSDAEARKFFLQRFEQHGIMRDRLDFLGLTPSKEEHLKAYHDVDIALDTFPYNGTTTTCDTLWMGVPVMALEGKVHAGRVGYSLLQHVGLYECIAQSSDNYVESAVALALQPARLEQLRMSMRQRLLDSALCQPGPFMQTLEAAYRGFWSSWCRQYQ